MEQLRFHGAAREVTGSMHLLEINGYTIALDCGLFHGRRKEAERKNRSFPIPPRKLDAVVLSHAHIDHCGKLPRLVREGYEGPIYATSPTADLVDILLADSAHIQEEDTEYWNRKAARRGEPPIEPLYTKADAEAAVRQIERQRLGRTFEVVPGVTATYYEAGHMLGSAMIHLRWKHNNEARSLTFTGDLGRPGKAILRDPAPLPECDYLICESTYGGRTTPDAEGMREQLAEVINDTIRRGGKLIVPAFAVGRTQVIVYFYNQLVHEGKITKPIPLIVDSPLAVRATQVFRAHPEVYDEEAMNFKADAGGLFRSEWCEYTKSVDDSKALHERKEPMIIVSASGMCEFGRILHHLKNNIEDSRSTVLIAGYQGAHTLGRRLVERVNEVRIFGETYSVNARIRVLNGFSGHANCHELEACTAPLAKGCRRAFLVHGDPDQSEKLAERMRKNGFASVEIPESGQAYPLE